MAKKENPLKDLKYEVAKEMGIDLNNINPGELSSKQNGYIGGYMVKKLVEQAKNSQKNK